MPRSPLRPRGFDDLGLERALSDRLLPFLVAAMAFLAALAIAGFLAAAGIARHWQQGAAAAVTVQVPSPTAPAADATGDKPATRLARALALLHEDPSITSARALSASELAKLLRPWLGSVSRQLDLPLPAVIAVRLAEPSASLQGLTAKLKKAVPGTLVESHGIWAGRLMALAESLQVSAGVALLVVAAVAIAVVAVATHAGLATRREAIEIVHGLGATDRYIAARFAARATRLALFGGIAGAVAALPVLLTLASVAAPFGRLDAPAALSIPIGGLPPLLWLALPLLPIAAAAIGYVTAQVTVRSWLRRLP